LRAYFTMKREAGEMTERAQNPFRSFLDNVARRLGTWAEEHPSQAADLAWALQEIANARPNEEGEIRAAEQLFRAVVPPNWWNLSIGAQAAARRTMLETGLCLVWVPRASVIPSIVSAKTKAERDRVLVAAEADLLEDVEAVLADVTHVRLEYLAGAAREAHSGYRTGYPRAAQALASSILSGVLDEHFGMPGFKNAVGRLEAERPDEVGLRVFRRVSVQWAARAAILSSWLETAGSGGGSTATPPHTA